MEADRNIPMNYYSSMRIIEEGIKKAFPNPEDYIFVSEGSNTMDISRSIFMNHYAKQRLDAGTFGTMGIGFPFALAAQVVHPKKQVIMVMGDSAFGFSAMELETLQRYNLPVKIIIINNNGIAQGVEEIDRSGDPQNIPVTALSPTARYELMAQCFDGKG